VKIEVVRVIPPRPEEKPPKKKPPEKKRVASERKAPPKTPETAPVQGLSPEALTPQATGIAAPVGNTLLTGDEGKRINPEDYKPMAGDLSADARLILSSVKVPAYTEAALEANLEGNFIVDVFVDEAGKVLQAEVRKKVGFGMDERILEAARLARFTPRKNKFGRSEEGWAEIKFTLVIP
jgi:protein TonB